MDPINAAVAVSSFVVISALAYGNQLVLGVTRMLWPARTARVATILVALATGMAAAPAAATAQVATLHCIPDDGAELWWGFRVAHGSGDSFWLHSRFGPPRATRLQEGDAERETVFLLSNARGHVGLLTVLPDGRYLMTIHNHLGIADPGAQTGSGSCRSFEH